MSGPEQKIKVYDDGKYHHESVDYAAKPDYHFAYGVEDPKSKVLQSRQETRRGDAVKGEYRYFLCKYVDYDFFLFFDLIVF